VLPIVNQYEEAQSMLRKAEQEMRELNQRLTKAEDAETLAKVCKLFGLLEVTPKAWSIDNVKIIQLSYFNGP